MALTIPEVVGKLQRSALEHQIDHTDREIDALVYELYGLSDKEIALVEEATS